MKKIKIILIAMLAILTLAGYSVNAQVIKEKPKFNVVVNTTLERAIKNPFLVRAIYIQVHKQDVIAAHTHIYVAEVHYLGTVYYISGTLDQWMLFFLMDGGGTATSTIKYRGGATGRE